MKLTFRQGIARQQTDTSGTPLFLQKTGSNTITLYVSPTPTLLTFAHGIQTDYLFEERKTVTDAWKGPFEVNVDYWLFWDLDLLSGFRTFGHTTVEPITSAAKPLGQVAADQHWFDLVSQKMMVYSNGRWIEKIRVFAGKLDEGAILIPNKIGSQVGLIVASVSGFLIFDDEDNAVKKFDRFGKGKFLTTESPLSTQVSKLANFKLEASAIDGQAVEFIPSYYVVAFRGERQLGLASNTTPYFPAIGLSIEEMGIGEVRTFISRGYVTNEQWDWQVPAGSKLFSGTTGELVTDVPQTYSLQQVATVISSRTVFIDIKQIIILDDS